ncbi:MAG: 50S ribosomal protein L6 [Chitinophagaceae bacterium]|nr:MAG: 50S ribosomal protein L6 [Chitinophagaceae bacterium]
MSRIGNLPIPIPEKVKVEIKENNEVVVQGPNGSISQQFSPEMIISMEEGNIIVKRPSEQKRHKAQHGLIRTLVANMITGVSDGYKRTLEVNGVGYRASNQGQILELSVGYSHPVYMEIPEEVKLSTETKKGSPPKILLESNDKQLLGLVASKIRAIRKPEPYKGKGIKYSDEILRRKAGKTAAK